MRQCCMAEFGDNSVVVFPSEIRNICEKAGLYRDDFVIPTALREQGFQRENTYF